MRPFTRNRRPLATWHDRAGRIGTGHVTVGQHSARRPPRPDAARVGRTSPVAREARWGCRMRGVLPMLRFPWLRGSRSARGTPPMRRALRGHPFLLPILSLVLLSQTGCQSGVFGPCSSCNTLRRGSDPDLVPPAGLEPEPSRARSTAVRSLRACRWSKALPPSSHPRRWGRLARRCPLRPRCRLRSNRSRRPRLAPRPVAGPSARRQVEVAAARAGRRVLELPTGRPEN